MSERDSDAATLDDARALLDAFIENDWSKATIRANGREYSFSRDTISGGLGAGAEASASASVPVAGSESVKAPHVGTVASLAPVGAMVAAGETVVGLSVLDEIVDIPAPRGGTVISHGAGQGALVEFGQVLIELAA